MKFRAYLGELERVPTNLPVIFSASEGLTELLPELPTYKHQEHCLCFDHDFDNDDDDDDDNDNDSIVNNEAKSPRHQQHADHQHATRRPRHPPSFISCPNGTLLCVLSRNNSKKILDTSHMDLEDILLL